MESLYVALQSFNFFIAGFIFISYAITDALYVEYTLDITERNEYQAATVGSLIHFLLAFGVISYTENWLYIFPIAMGSWIGTFTMVRRARQKKIKLH